jgi:hypothetical protein
LILGDWGSPARTGGGFEILGGLEPLVPTTRRAAAWGLVALLIAVVPANLYMAMHPVEAGAPSIPAVLRWGRLPLQALQIWWVLCARGRATCCVEGCPETGFLYSSAGRSRVEGLGEGNVVTVRIRDHHRLNCVAGCPLTCVDAQFIQSGDLLGNAGYSQREGAGASAFGELIDLQPAAALETPFGDLSHRPGWRAAEDSFVPFHGGLEILNRDAGKCIID